MIPQVIRDVASFLAAGVLCLLPLAEQRELPCSLCDGPIVTAAYADRFPIIAVVESWVEFHLIKGSSRKRRNDSDAVRPAWELLALAIVIFAYQYLSDLSLTASAVAREQSVFGMLAVIGAILWVVRLGRPCPDCGGKRGKFHQLFCTKECCPFCGQVAVCDCIITILNLNDDERRVVEEYADDDVEPLKSIMRRWKEAWVKKGRIRW